MIDPAGIPVIAGNMDALHGHADTIAAAGTEFADTGADLHSVWQGLATCYVAPESEQLLAATGPIRDAAQDIGDDWRACAAALHVYADATAAVQVRLADIRARAELFVAAHTAEDVAADEGLRDAEAGLLAEVAAAMAEWDAAQRECANAISALHGGPMLRADDGDGVLTDGEFGYSPAQYTATTTTDGAGAPWGRSTTPDRGIGGDIAAFFGGIGDAVVGGVVELGALFGRDPATGEWSAVTANGAWESLVPVALAHTGVIHPVVDSMDRAGLFLVLDRGAVAQARDAAGKSLIAYDQWDDDPARAVGTVTGNVLLAVVGTKGAGAGISAAGRGAATVAPRVGAGIQNTGAAIARMPTLADLALRAKGRLPAFGGPRYGPPPPAAAGAGSGTQVNLNTDHGGSTTAPGHISTVGRPAGTLPHGSLAEAMRSPAVASPATAGHTPSPVVGHDSSPERMGASADPESPPMDDLSGRPYSEATPLEALPTDERVRQAAALLGDGARTFHDNPAAAAYGAHYWNDYGDALPVQQRTALFDYSSSPPHIPSYQEINSYLRGQALADADVLNDVAHIDQALKGRPVPEDIVVSRGTGVQHFDRPPEALVGTIQRDDAYMSTSLGDAAFANKEAILHLRVPEGTPAMYMDRVTAYPAERELLLGRGLSWRVENVIWRHGQWQIYAEVVG